MSQSNGNPSVLECLPRDIMWKVIECEPKSAFPLRATSREMRRRMHEYSTLRPIDGKLSIVSLSWGKRTTAISVPINTAYGLKLRLVTQPYLNLVERVRKCNNDNIVTYSYEICGNVINNIVETNIRMYFCNCYDGGMKMERVEAEEDKDGSSLEYIVSMTEGYQIKYFEYKSTLLKQTTFDLLTTFITDHDVEQFALKVQEIGVAERERLLISLSTLVRSLSITQSRTQTVDDGEQQFFGIHNVEWGPIIMDMFSRKLDKLNIENHSYSEYLGAESVQFLREHLPKIGKKVWLDATCSRDIGRTSSTRNNHVFITSKLQEHGTNPYSVLTIKHESRKEEKFDLGLNFSSISNNDN